MASGDSEEGKTLTKLFQQYPRVSQFSGDVAAKGEVSYDVWKFEVNCLVKGKLYTPEAIALGVRKSVKGEAGRVLMHIGEEAKVTDILEKFDKIFGTVVSGETLLQQFYSEYQKPNESVASWGCRLEDLLIRAKEKDKVPEDAFDLMLRTKFWSNLHSERLQNATRHKLGTVDSFYSLLAAVREAEQEIVEYDRMKSAQQDATGSKVKTGRLHHATTSEVGSEAGVLATVLERLDRMESGHNSQSTASLEAIVARLEKIEAKMALQKNTPLASASCKLRNLEYNCAPIEKEMLAIQFSTEKFREYILGKETLVQTTICHKPLTSAPLRLQTMLLKLKGYDLKVEYLPGKRHFLADTLSRASLNEVPEEAAEMQVSTINRMSVSQICRVSEKDCKQAT